MHAHNQQKEVPNVTGRAILAPNHLTEQENRSIIKAYIPKLFVLLCFRMHLNSNCVGSAHAYRHTAAAEQLPLKLLEIKSLTKALCLQVGRAL